MMPSAPVRGPELVTTLFELGREVTAVLDVDELLARIPRLIGRLIRFEAFAVYLLDGKRAELRIGYSVGYPEEFARNGRLQVGQGIVGAAVETERALVINDVRTDARYMDVVPGSRSELVVPLRHKGRVLGALNVLSSNLDEYSELDATILEQFAAQVAVALENARLFEREREHSATLETLAEIGREVAAILDLDDLLTRLASLTRRVIDYRTFGIMLLNEAAGELEMKVAIRYGDAVELPRVRLGVGLVGHAALHKEPVLVPDVSVDPRYLKVVEETRSELVIPLMLQDRCIGVFDLESPELDAFTKGHVEILTLLGAQAAVAIENARLYEQIRANELRRDRELRFARRVQAALLPAGPPKRFKGVDLAGRLVPARELGGDLYDYLFPEAHALVVAVGDVSGKGLPAALYGAFAGELIRSRTFRRRFQPERATPARVLEAVNMILHERQLEEYYCTLCYAWFDLKRRSLTIANSGLPYPIHCRGDRCGVIEVSGIPLGTFPGSTYEELTLDLVAGDVFAFCSDGVYEATDKEGREFGSERLAAVVERSRHLPAADIVEAIFQAVVEFRGDAPSGDDTTAVVLRITT